MTETPHYLRFARALVLATVLTPAASGCCPLVPDSVVCSHCSCPYGGTSTGFRPVACSTINRDTACCPLPVPGPLAPPSLTS